MSVAVAPPLAAQTPEAPHKEKGRQVALLIGVENYERVTPLRFVGNDVQRLADTLRNYGGYDRVVELTDAASDEDSHPHRAVLLARLPDVLSRCSADDTLIVYFSGHGFRDRQGAMYLAPLDIDPADLEATGIPVAWFREQIARCPAGLKLLVLDACHAGSEKGGSEANLPARDLDLFADLEGVITLASSTADEPSQMWPEKEQSLFSYWLNQALRGHADTDGDGRVNIDELNAYLHENVRETALARFSSRQTPVRKIGLKIPGQPVVEYLQPQSLKLVVADMAEQLADVIADRWLGNVGVLEFTNETISGERLGTSFGLLGRRCADELEERLAMRGSGRFEVASRESLQQALQAMQFGLADLGSGERLKDLSQRAGGVRVLAKGQLYGRLGAMLNLRCKLIDTQTSRTLAVVGGVAWLTTQEWAMLAKSVKVEADDYRPESPLPGKTPRPEDHVVVDRLDARSMDNHPLQDPNTPFVVKLMVNGRERKGQFRGNDYFVPLRKGEEFAVWVENRSGNLVCMRLLVDGLNTLPEKERKQNDAPQPFSDSKALLTEIIAKPITDLEQARHWVIDPKNPRQLMPGNRNVVSVPGFVTRTGLEGEFARFKVVDADHSQAARTNFTTQLGLITAAFYAPAGTRAVGVDLGKRERANLKEYEGTKAGPMLAVIHIRYYDPDEG
ncbi:MAG TPA: caspase family protein [Pirellulales bacterium]|nr:caspase family protein [Pirellulales bacterium]